MGEALERVVPEQESKRFLEWSGPLHSIGVVLLEMDWKIHVCDLLHEKMKQEGKQFFRQYYMWTVLNNMNHRVSNPVQ